MRVITRRTWAKSAGGAVLWPWASAIASPSTGLHLDKLLGRYPSPSGWQSETRMYRVDAAVTVLSSPLHWFRGIGHGFLTLGQTAAARDGSTAIFMRFGAASNLDRAHGFDRLGFIEEAAVEQTGEFANFGFITAGHESSRTTLGSAFTAMDLFANGEECWFRRAGVAGPPLHQLDEQLICHVRNRLPLSGAASTKVALPAARPTFLYALLQAIQSPKDRFCCTYVYNAKQFDVNIRRTENPR